MRRFGPARRMMGGALRAVSVVGLLVCGMSGVLSAQGGLSSAFGRSGDFPVARSETPLLTLDQDRMFAESAFGRRVAGELARASEVLAAENRTIEAQLREEERALTEQRPSLTPEEFRALADAFDEKAVGFRRSQDAKARALQRRDEAEREAFLRAALPVLTALVEELDAVAILDARVVLLASETVDVTDRAIARIDAAIDDGAALSPAGPILPNAPEAGGGSAPAPGGPPAEEPAAPSGDAGE